MSIDNEKVIRAALALAGIGGGVGLVGGAAEGKGIPETLKDIVSGGATGAVGGAILGAGVSELRPLLSHLAATPSPNILTKAVKVPIHIGNAIANFGAKSLGGTAGLALLGAGGLAGLGALLKGSGVSKKDQRGSFFHDLAIARAGRAKISSVEDQTMPLQKLLDRKYANILRQYAKDNAAPSTNMQLDAEISKQQSAAPAPGSTKNAFDQQEAFRQIQEGQRNLARAEAQSHSDNALARRRQLASSIGAPLGSALGSMAGQAYSNWMGKKQAPGWKGRWLGHEVDVVDPVKAREFGSLAGSMAGGLAGNALATALHKNDITNEYMNRYGF